MVLRKDAFVFKEFIGRPFIAEHKDNYLCYTVCFAYLGQQWEWVEMCLHNVSHPNDMHWENLIFIYLYNKSTNNKMKTEVIKPRMETT